MQRDLLLPERFIALYCRVSTDEQAREGISLDEQQERLKAYCRALGWKEEVKLYVDDGYSAKSMERPELSKLLHAVKTEKVSKVMVTKLDRMSRKLLDLLNLIDLFQECGVSFVSISESFDTNTPSGRLTLQVLGAVAEFERERIRERVMDNMFHAANQGKWLTQSPYGYKLEDKVLVIDETEANIVRRVFDLYQNKGHGFFSIAKQLNEEAIPSRQNKEWSLRAIKLMLTNPVYKGTLIWNRVDSSKKKRKVREEDEWVVVEDCVPAIVSKELWQSVQEKIIKKPIAPRAQTSPHLLGGLLKCGYCGSGMSIGYSGSANNRYRVYRCSANKNKGTCTSKQYRADDLEKQVKDTLIAIVNQSGAWQELDVRIELKKQQQTIDSKQYEKALERYNRKVEAYTAGLIDLEVLKEEKNLLDRLNATKVPTSDIQAYASQQMEEQLRKSLSSFISSFDNLPIEKLKKILHSFIHRIEVDEHNLRVILEI